MFFSLHLNAYQLEKAWLIVLSIINIYYIYTKTYIIRFVKAGNKLSENIKKFPSHLPFDDYDSLQ